EQDAYAASGGKRGWYAQKCWNQTSKDGTMHVLPGEYSSDTGTFWRLRISPANDGKKPHFKKLLGHGRVLLRGPRPLAYDPKQANQGGPWLLFDKSAGYVQVE